MALFLLSGTNHFSLRLNAHNNNTPVSHQMILRISILIISRNNHFVIFQNAN